MSAEAMRLRYLADKVNTATPGQLIVMLYDRLGVDMELAALAQSEQDFEAAGTALLHAQRVVAELLASLDTSVWSGGDDLAALYRYLLLELIEARTTPDPATLRTLARIVTDLRSAWHTAALELISQSVGAAAGQSAVTGVRVG